MNGETDLWQFFEEREEQIIAQRKKLSEELEALRAARAAIENRQRAKGGNESQDKLTIKDMVRSVLRKNPEGGTSDQIINWIGQLHRVEVARTSLSPQLSRLKADREVELNDDNGIWNLTAEGEMSFMASRFDTRSEDHQRRPTRLENLHRRR